MRSEIILAAIIVAGTIIAVRYLDRAEERIVAARTQNAAHAAASETALPAPSVASAYYSGYEVRIEAGPDQQYFTTAQINRRSAEFLVDTGASHVAIRDSDARDAGIYTAWADFRYPVSTANGQTKAAFVTIDEIEIGGLRLEGVEAFILQDDQLSVNLLGMSFLSRLESVEARGGELVLKG